MKVNRPGSELTTRSCTVAVSPTKQCFSVSNPPGFVHIDVKYLPQMSDEINRSYLFLTIGPATRRVFVKVKNHKAANATRSFLNALNKACTINIEKILTDNCKEFTERLFTSRERQATGKHEFDQLCQALGHHRTPSVQAAHTQSQWYGRALQRTHCRCAQNTPLHQR